MSTKVIYLAGALFDYKALSGNALLAEAIHQLSQGRYECCLPQDLEQLDRAKRVRDTDLAAVATSDAILCLLDGTELDSGTVVEKMVALMLGIPCVVARSDFRQAGDGTDFQSTGSIGDQAASYFNLMVAYYPGTEMVFTNAMADYKQALQAADSHPYRDRYNSKHLAALIIMHEHLAHRIIEALDRVFSRPSVLPPDQALQTHFFNMAGLEPDIQARITQAWQKASDLKS